MEGVDPTEDAVGRTSARLLAAGVPSAERLDALHLLAILDATADGAGRVRRPLDDLAGEFELDAGDVIRSLDHLEEAGAVVREGPTVVLPRHGEDAVGGMLLADFLDDVRTVLEDDHVRPVSRLQVVGRASAGVLAAAALVAVALLVPGGGGSTTTTMAAPSSSSATVRADDDDVRRVPRTAEDASPGTTGAIDRPSMPVRNDPEPAAAATTLATIACPAEGPTVLVRPDPEEIDGTAATVGSTPSINGTATNPTGHDLTITVMIARSGTTEGDLLEPLPVPAGQTVTWSIAPQRLNVLDPAGAVIGEWEWTDPSVAGCPS